MIRHPPKPAHCNTAVAACARFASAAAARSSGRLARPLLARTSPADGGRITGSGSPWTGISGDGGRSGSTAAVLRGV